MQVLLGHQVAVVAVMLHQEVPGIHQQPILLKETMEGRECLLHRLEQMALVVAEALVVQALLVQQVLVEAEGMGKHQQYQDLLLLMQVAAAVATTIMLGLRVRVVQQLVAMGQLTVQLAGRAKPTKAAVVVVMEAVQAQQVQAAQAAPV